MQKSHDPPDSAANPSIESRISHSNKCFNDEGPRFCILPLPVKHLLLFIFAALPALAQTIETPLYVVRREADSAISIGHQPTHRIFLKNVRLNGDAKFARILPVQHKIFGAGQSLEISHSNGA